LGLIFGHATSAGMSSDSTAADAGREMRLVALPARRENFRRAIADGWATMAIPT
jgi:hypothetical protein